MNTNEIKNISDQESVKIGGKKIPIFSPQRVVKNALQNYVRDVLMPILLTDKALPSDEVDRLKDKNYCKDKFKGLGLELLRKKSKGRARNDGRSGYWKDVFKYKGQELYVCSEWQKNYHEENKENIKCWLYSLAKNDKEARS